MRWLLPLRKLLLAGRLIRKTCRRIITSLACVFGNQGGKPFRRVGQTWYSHHTSNYNSDSCSQEAIAHRCPKFYRSFGIKVKRLGGFRSQATHPFPPPPIPLAQSPNTHPSTPRKRPVFLVRHVAINTAILPPVKIVCHLLLVLQVMC